MLSKARNYEEVKYIGKKKKTAWLDGPTKKKTKSGIPWPNLRLIQTQGGEDKRKREKKEKIDSWQHISFFSQETHVDSVQNISAGYNRVFCKDS